MIGYEISVRCICGNENSYRLNGLRYPLVTLGRQQQDQVGVPDINLCADDQCRMSRQMLYFVYNKELQDWEMVAGAPERQDYQQHRQQIVQPQQWQSDTFREKKGQQLFCLYRDDFFRAMDRQVPLLLQGQKLNCHYALQKLFRPLGQNRAPLSQLVGLGIMDFRQVSYKNNPCRGVQHPLLGTLPFGWYIEIKADRRAADVAASFVNNSIVWGPH